LIREVRRPLRHQRGLPLAAEGDEGEDARTLGFVGLGLRPGDVESLSFGFAADEFRRGIFDDAGDVGGDEVVRTWRGGSGLETFSSGSA
jgi:hypothetical protein